MRKKGIFSGKTTKCVDISHASPSTCKIGGATIRMLWKSNDLNAGLGLREFKTPEYVSATAEGIAELMLYDGCGGAGWSIVNAPKRRHREWHFATEVARKVAELTKSEFCERFVVAFHNNRFNCVMCVKNRPAKDKVVVIDDIITTGATLKAMDAKLQDYERHYYVAVNNR